MRGPRTRTDDIVHAGAVVLAAVLLLGPASLSAQEAGGEGQGPTVRWGGLLRTGLEVGPEHLGRDDGFRIHDARLRAGGEIGIVFDYFAQAAFDDRTDEFRLLDARLSLDVVPRLAVELGQFKAPFGREALQGKGEITFVERSRIIQIAAPGRQVGVQLAGQALDERLDYRAGIFNGTGRDFENDGGFLYAARASYAPMGTARFHDELSVRMGASVAFSSDSAAPLAGMADAPADELVARTPRLDFASFRGDRWLWGVDVEAGHRGFFLRAEYLRGAYDPDEPPLADEDGDDVIAEGAYVEGGYSFLGAIEGVVRWDALNDVLRSVEGMRVGEEEGGGTDFLVFGLNLFPGYETKIGFQYAVGLAGARRGPALADGEFALNAQVDF